LAGGNTIRSIDADFNELDQDFISEIRASTDEGPDELYDGKGYILFCVSLIVSFVAYYLFYCIS
jgi:hypothetical protein